MTVPQRKVIPCLFGRGKVDSDVAVLAPATVELHLVPYDIRALLWRPKRCMASTVEVSVMGNSISCIWLYSFRRLLDFPMTS